jgi:hypothetical protein
VIAARNSRKKNIEPNSQGSGISANTRGST